MYPSFVSIHKNLLITSTFEHTFIIWKDRTHLTNSGVIISLRYFFVYNLVRSCRTKTHPPTVNEHKELVLIYNIDL